MNKYLEANTHLAVLLGWTGVFDAGGTLVGTPPDGAPDSRGQTVVPDWCRDWRACGPLLCEYGARQCAFLGFAYARWVAREVLRAESGHSKDHPDRNTTVRYLIVQAVTQYLIRTEGKESA